jgi:CheY-like chemotaxis protein
LSIGSGVLANCGFSPEPIARALLYFPRHSFSSSSPSSNLMNKQRILVVDDEPKVSDLVRIFLERTKRYEVRVENRSANALAAAQEFRPDMVLLDVDMPGKDGGVIASEMRAQPMTRDLPILFLTSLVSRAEAGDRETIRGGMRFLAKPLDPKVLVDVVDRLLADRKAVA